MVNPHKGIKLSCMKKDPDIEKDRDKSRDRGQKQVFRDLSRIIAKKDRDII